VLRRVRGAPSDGAGVPEPRRLGRVASAIRELRSGAIARLGRPIDCEVCGEELFRGLPVVWRGRLKFLGSEQSLVRVDWDKMNRMTFSHVLRDECDARRDDR